MKLTELPEVVRPAMASRATGLSRKELKQLLEKGELKVYETRGKHRRYYRDDLIAYLKRKRHDGR